MALDAAAVDALSVGELVTKRRRMVRELRAASAGRELRIAVLGGSTTNEFAEFLELHLLANGFNPVFYQSEYGRYYEDAVHDSSALVGFKPELIYLHTSIQNISAFPGMQATEEEYAQTLHRELARFRQIWSSLEEQPGCQIIQNNFELPPAAILGNLDAVATGGRTRFVLDLNAGFAEAARSSSRLLIQDVHSISSHIGLAQWFDWDRWFSYKLPYTPEGTLALARSFSAMVKAIYGKARKVLVLDLDNTLWGGEIGDDGADKIQIGRETPVAEAYTAFQEYCLALRERGVLLAVCSKNNEEVAREGFAHPDSVLRLEHFSAFKANWEPKHENLIEIAKELNLGVESFVFVDDNPAERAIVAAQLPAVAVPDVGSEVSDFIEVLDAGRFFEPVSLSREDLERAAMYSNRTQQIALESKFSNYGEYLDSLEMKAEIDVFRAVYLERIAQLTNKTNQFNLTTRRFTLTEMEAFAKSDRHIPLYGRLRDRFGDNGLVSVVLGRKEDEALHIDLWLMSCRVLKRDMELAMLDSLAERAIAANLRHLVGYYVPTKKNGLVADHYQKLGFVRQAMGDGGTSTWTLDLSDYAPRTRHILINGTGEFGATVGLEGPLE